MGRREHKEGNKEHPSKDCKSLDIRIKIYKDTNNETFIINNNN